MKRPETVPAEAVWSEDDAEWVRGPKNDAGEYHGEVYYWRPNGTLVCTCPHSDGKPHGESRRFHDNGDVAAIALYEHGTQDGLSTWFACDEPTSEGTHAPGMSTEIRRIEVLYNAGRPTRFGYYLADETEVNAKGEPLPPRPDGVPADALRMTKGDGWIAGSWDADGKKDGALRHYRGDGTLQTIETRKAGVLHGPLSYFFEDGSLRSRTDYVDGARVGVFEQYRRSGELARRGWLDLDGWAGPLVDFHPDGELLRWVGIPAPAPRSEPAPPEDDELEFFETLEVELDPELLSEFIDHRSPAGLAALIAIGWGGNAHRDAVTARHARWAAKSVPDESLQAALQQTGLETAPRLITATRLRRLKEALATVECVDLEALDDAFSRGDGVGTTAALLAGDARTVDVLRNRLSSEGRLDLQWLGLTELPPEVRRLPDIVEIEASNNELRTVPAEVADLPFLQCLRLSDNAIESLPSELRRLRDFVNLHMAGNGLTSIPTTVFELEELAALNLSNNSLEAVPEALNDLERLHTMWLSDNPLQTLPSLGGLRSLTFLHLGNVAWAEPPAALWELQSLETLWLAGPELKHLPPEVAQLESLTELMVWHSSLESIPEELFGMTQLRELRIKANPLPEGTIDRLREALPDCTIY